MAKSVRVQFEDGTSHVYEGVPDDVDASAVESRAAEEFGKKPVTAHSPNQGSAPDAKPPETPKGPVAPSFEDYSTLPQSAKQFVAGAQIPIQLAAEHPAEAAAGLGLYKAGQVANAYVGGKRAEADAINKATAEAAKKEARMAAGGAYGRGIPPATGSVAPGPMAGWQNGPTVSAQAQQATADALNAQRQAAQSAEQSLASKVRAKAASMVTGLTEAAPMLGTAGKVAGKVLPGAGLALGGLEAYNRAKEGDYLGAGLAGVGGVAGLVPGVGTAINLGATGINAGRDYQKYLEAKRKYEEQQKAMGR